MAGAAGAFGYLFLLTESLLPPPLLTHPLRTTPDVTTMPVKVKQGKLSALVRPLYLKLKNMLDFQCKLLTMVEV